MRTGSGHQMPIQMSLGLRPPSTADQQVAHFHRESDRHRLRAMLTGALAAGVLVNVEKASLQSLARSEADARARYGMVAPIQQQVQLAREFVAGGSAATAAVERTAAMTAATGRQGAH